MNETKPFPLDLPPGIQRDGAHLDKFGWIDGQWMRFDRGRPRKMGGLHRIIFGLNISSGKPRGMELHWQGSTGYLHYFTKDGVFQRTITDEETYTAEVDRTPGASDFTASASDSYIWQSLVAYEAGSAADVLVCHPGNNLTIYNNSATEILIGNVSQNLDLVGTGKNVDGGIMYLHPFLVGFGSGGEVAWTNDNTFTDWAGGTAGDARVGKGKFVVGKSTRNRTGLLWGLDNLVLMKYEGGAAVFSFTTLSETVSILSSSGVVEYDGRFYWPGTDRFYMYDGRVQEIANDMNSNLFFNTMSGNLAYRQRVWGIPIPRWGEIWWFYPSAGQTECDRAIILNLRETSRAGKPIWYDTTCARACGVLNIGFQKPLMAKISGSNHELFAHEMEDYDQVDAGTGDRSAIEAYIETSPLSTMVADENRWTHIDRIEHDAEQAGDVTLTVRGRKYPRSSDVDTTSTITDTDEKTDIKQQRRHLRLKFSSNTTDADTGAYFNMGVPLLYLAPGDGRQ